MAWLLLAASLVGSLPAAAFAQGRDIWRAKANGSFVTLSFGPVDEKAPPVFLLSCLNGVRIAVLSVNMDFPENESGDPITIELSAGGQTTPVAGETAREEGTGVIYGEAGDIAVKPILDILGKKGPVSMKVGAIGTELSEAGRAEGVDQFAKDCTLD
jgi:hypothetical protein